MSFLLLLSCQSSEIYLEILQPLDKSAYEGEVSIDFIASLQSTTKGEDVDILWESSLDGGISQYMTEFTTNELSIGLHQVTVSGVWRDIFVQDSISIYIGASEYIEKPSIEFVQPNREEVLEDTDTSIQVFVFDQQTSPTNLRIHMYQDGELLCDGKADSEGYFGCTTSFSAGEHLLQAIVTDADSNESDSTISLLSVTRSDFDSDHDGYTPNEGDCDDENENTYPFAIESCDGLDNDCDSSTPMEVGSECYDDDGDGFCESPPCLNASESQADCNDIYEQINPDATEIPNGFDDDCDGKIDEGTSQYDDDGDGFCETPPCSNSDQMESDCVDSDANISPKELEICGDGIDNNCNNQLNEVDAVGCSPFYLDEDGDTFGVPSDTQCYCDDGLFPYTGVDTSDCYDQNSDAHPLQENYFTEERGDGSFDYDCSGQEELELEGEGDGCETGILTAIGMQCQANDVGWQGGQKYCGESGFWIQECSPDIPIICVAICVATGNLAQCLECGAVCLPDMDYKDQGCR
jgi:hypothetical protein